jgi:hypothetical protein
MRRCPAGRTTLGSLAPWLGDNVAPERREWRAADRVACLRWWRRQRTGRCWSFSSGVDELGDAVQPLFVEVVGRAVTQELTRHEQRGL